MIGEVRFLREVKSPWNAHVYIEKFDRGQWNINLIDRRVVDFCAELQNPAMPWYFLTSQFQHKQCPFPAGHVEVFKNGKVMDCPENAPASLVGKYRFTWTTTFRNGLKEETECAQGGFELMEL